MCIKKYNKNRKINKTNNFNYFNKFNKLNDDFIYLILDFLNIKCNVCKIKINNIDIFFKKYNNYYKKSIFCSKECYNFI